MGDDSFADVLEVFIRKTGYSYGILAARSKLKKSTISNWANGYVTKPRHWQDVVKLAKALNSNESEATALLLSSGHPSLAELLLSLGNKEEKKLLDQWAPAIFNRMQHAPFQSDPDIPHFVGRDELLHTLLVKLRQGHHETTYSLEGMGGAGKTTLAAHLAHLLKPHLPDGVLWTRVDTSNTMSTLYAFANAYGQDVSQLTDLQSRSQVVRDILSNKRALMVLDNVQEDEQIELLLPPTGPCAVLITTRQKELWSTRSAHKYHIGPFDKEKEESVALFVKILGENRARKEIAPLNEIAELVGHLPLAVDIVGSKLAGNSDLLASYFLDRLRQEQKRLDTLHYGNQSLRLSFSLTYDSLPGDQKQFFASLGAFGGEDFNDEAVAYIATVSRDLTISHLTSLCGLSLVQHAHPKRYRLHPLLRDFARERSSTDDSVKRMVTFFANHSKTNEANYAQLELEFSNTLAALDIAFAKEMQAELVKSTNSIYEFLVFKGLYGLADTLLKHAETATRNLGDMPSLAKTLLQLGRIKEKIGDYLVATECFQEGLKLAQDLGDQEMCAALLMNLGVTAAKRGERKQAMNYLEEGLEAAQKTDSRRLTVHIFQNMGAISARQGHYDYADEYYHRALPLAQEIGDIERICNLYLGLGSIALRKGNYDEAKKYYEQGLTLAYEIKHSETILDLTISLGTALLYLGNLEQTEKYYLEALAHAQKLDHSEKLSHLFTNLGELAVKQQLPEKAHGYYDEALALARKIRNPWLISGILSEWGQLHLEQNNWMLARETFEECLKISRVGDYPIFIGNSLWGLAQVALSQGNIDHARQQGEESRTILKSSNHHNAENVERWLDNLPSSNQQSPP